MQSQHEVYRSRPRPLVEMNPPVLKDGRMRNFPDYQDEWEEIEETLNDPVVQYRLTLNYEKMAGISDKLFVKIKGNTIVTLSLSTIDRFLSDIGFKYIAAGYGSYPYYFFVFTDDAGNEQFVTLMLENSNVTACPNGKEKKICTTSFTCTLWETYERSTHRIVETDFQPIIRKYIEVNLSAEEPERFVEEQSEKLSYLI